jgi:hypothetical protein
MHKKLKKLFISCVFLLNKILDFAIALYCIGAFFLRHDKML